jgi:hypothetical protein
VDTVDQLQFKGFSYTNPNYALSWNGILLIDRKMSEAGFSHQVLHLGRNFWPWFVGLESDRGAWIIPRCVESYSDV